MASEAAGVSDTALIDLIYQHLKENGHKRAASVLKKHAPQIGSGTSQPSSNVSLSDIFTMWASDERGAPQMRCAGEKPSNSNAVSKQKTSRKAASKKKDKSQVTAAAEKQQRGKKEPKKAKITRVEILSSSLPDLTSKTTGEDSDSDSSLDVEKWKRLALAISDADLAKMDALTSPSTPAASTSRKSAKKEKPSQTKKGRSPNVKASTKKKKETDSDILSKAHKVSNLGDKKCTVVLEQTPKKTKHKAKHSESKVEATGTEIPKNLSEEVVVTQTQISNSPSVTTKKVKHKISDLSSPLLGDIETPSKVQKSKANTPKAKKSVKFVEPVKESVSSTEVNNEFGCSHTTFRDSNSDDISDRRATEPSSKKFKSKKSVNPLQAEDMNVHLQQGDTETASSHLMVDQTKGNDSLLDPGSPSAKKSKSKKCVKPVECVDLKNTAQPEEDDVIKQSKTPSAGAKELEDSDTPSKKHKTKIYREPMEPVVVVTPSGEGETEAVNSLSKDDQSETLKKKKTKKAKSLAEADPAETPSKKLKAKKLEVNGIQSPFKEIEDHSETWSKKTKDQATNILSEHVILETPKKSKIKKATETDEVESSSKKASVDEEEGKAAESLLLEPDSTQCSSKKRKRKMPETPDHGVPSVTESSLQGVALNGASFSSPKNEKRKKEKSEGEENMLVSMEEDDPSEPKKRKKDKKKKKTESDDCVVPPPPLEELVENKQKKKKKKKKAGDEENPSIPTPDLEDEIPKKKKKSSKEKEHVDV